jgi:hypothetical protein
MWVKLPPPPPQMLVQHEFPVPLPCPSKIYLEKRELVIKYTACVSAAEIILNANLEIKYVCFQNISRNEFLCTLLKQTEFVLN